MMLTIAVEVYNKQKANKALELTNIFMGYEETLTHRQIKKT